MDKLFPVRSLQLITRETFESVKEKYQYYSSWAVWGEEKETPKSNVGDLTVLDPDANHDLLAVLNPNVVLVALNISRGDITTPLANFHDKRSESTDFKLRFALRGSPYWGAYITDIIKDFDQKISGEVVSYLRDNKEFEKENVNFFLQELKDIGAKKPTLVALGSATYKILKRHLKSEFKILKIRHYANFESKEDYREHVYNISSERPKHMTTEVTGRDNQIICQALQISIPIMLKHSLSTSNVNDMLRILEARSDFSSTKSQDPEVKKLIEQLQYQINNGETLTNETHSTQMNSALRNYLSLYGKIVTD